MKPIPTKVHGILDYASGALFLASPWLLTYQRNKAATNVAVGTGMAVLGLSAMTNYEMGLRKRVPMKTHLNIDTATGMLVAASPWLLGFSKRIAWPHLVFGLLEVGAGLLTQSQPTQGETVTTNATSQEPLPHSGEATAAP